MNPSQQYFSYIRWLMIAAGIWRLEIKEFSTSKKRFYNFYSVIIQLICTSPIISVTLDVPALMEADQASAFGNIGLAVFLAMIISKMLMCQSKPILRLVKVAFQNEFQMIYNVNADVAAIYKKHIKLNNFFITLLVMYITIILVSVITSGDVHCYQYLRQNQTVKPMLVNYWYPFDTNKYYALVLIDQNIRPTLAALCTAIVNAFVICIIIFVRLQLKLLQYSFRNFDKLELQGLDGPTMLKLICVKHQELIEYTVELNQSFNIIIFIDYMVSSITFAAQILQIIGGVEPIFTSAILSYTIIQLLIFAWSSNEIIVQSTELARALFESNWYDHDINIKAMAHIMMMRCQKPLSLMIGRFGVMDLDVGISRLKLAYSYTSLMRSGD
ncbi:odorant receptor 30a-like isoform X1 [Cylas formicarius]|uniref:odorant receptor 30a-like isoform X1 n=2 Tax=Cylas formicarius TaxID=197179 RepID=UPI002958609E|nr:odorant receptor 30a-like isoform X1 [Cylas formicarius]